MNALVVRKDSMNKFDFTIESAADHDIEASIHIARGRIKVVNAYLPPQESKHYGQELRPA